MEAEKALESLGNPWRSRATLPAYLIICVLRSVVSAWQYTAIVFIGANTDHECRLPDEDTYPSNNGSSLMQNSLDVLSAQGQCHLYNSTDNSTELCPNGWVYSGQRQSIVDEWDLVCDNDYLSDFSQMMYNLGTMIGSLFVGIMTDKLGRKWVFLSNSAGMAVLTIISAVVPSFYVFVSLRFITGIFHQGASVSGIVLACELFPMSSRGLAGTLIHCFWGTSMGLLALIALQVSNWRHLMLIMTLPSILVIPGCWILQESIPWLLAINRRQQARDILQKMARWNRVEIDNDIISDQPSYEEDLVTDVCVNQQEEDEKKIPTINVQDDRVIPGPVANKRLLALKLEEKLLNIINFSDNIEQIRNGTSKKHSLEQEQQLSHPYIPDGETAETPSLAIRHHRLELCKEQSPDDPSSRLLFSSAPELRSSTLLPSPKSVAKLNKLSLMSRASAADHLHQGLTPTGSGNIDEWQAMFQSRLHLERSTSYLNVSNAEDAEETETRERVGNGIQKQGFLDILRSKTLRKAMTVIPLAFLTVSMSYFGLSLTSGNLAGNMYVNYALTGLSEVPANLLLGFLISRS